MDNKKNINWFWNNNINNRLAFVAPTTPPCSSSSSSSTASIYSNRLQTSIGVCCVGMQSVNINESNNSGTFHPRKIQNCCKFNVVGPMTEQNFKNACTTFLNHGSSNDSAISNRLQAPETPNFMCYVNESSFSSVISYTNKPTSNSLNWHGRNNVGTNNNFRLPQLQTQRSFIKDPSEKPSTLHTAPKKKWIRHYMMGEVIQIYYFYVVYVIYFIEFNYKKVEYLMRLEYDPKVIFKY